MDKCLEHNNENCEICKAVLEQEKQMFLDVCGSCSNFKSFHATAGLCATAKSNCICKNPKAMIDMFDPKCSDWVLNEEYA